MTWTTFVSWQHIPSSPMLRLFMAGLVYIAPGFEWQMHGNWPHPLRWMVTTGDHWSPLIKCNRLYYQTLAFPPLLAAAMGTIPISYDYIMRHQWKNIQLDSLFPHHVWYFPTLASQLMCHHYGLLYYRGVTLKGEQDPLLAGRASLWWNWVLT